MSASQGFLALLTEEHAVDELAAMGLDAANGKFVVFSIHRRFSDTLPCNLAGQF
jgi:hypothetical protein